ncbi:Small ribosomal subunit biogenesis GTPase RsgA [Tepidimonas alkaliphilus]|uniref:Small ribosomal subunit biogenesis GTPase RsgA n=1 Tax=Tepidimonas alkaliphilus TaxID=2588942 RepID=A0A554WD17_9BURK|nr:ribosome small subunit-dependent GTPase A [Tepidimonas alkaliphilus]TSE21473.1 Small ribosomal subunit biogenesis GTPase RsgA [Tepidimonas alkaliphilus]
MRRQHPARTDAASAPLREGLVVAAYGRHLLVEDAAGARTRCHARGKRHEAVVGDRVRWQPSGDDGVIEAVLPRRNVLRRQDELRTKVFAANVDQVLVLLAAEPAMSEEQLARALIAARDAGVEALVALNKRDVQPAFDEAWQRLEPYRAMGETVLPLALLDPADPGLEALAARLRGRVTLVMGASGVGKSTLVNRLAPGAQAQTQTISRALGTGRHTTTHTTWYWLDAARHGALIDSPGFHAFGLHHLDPRRLAALMPDLAAHLGGCRFLDCTHRQEPGCAVRAALQPHGPLSPRRWQLYVNLYEELAARPAHG